MFHLFDRTYMEHEVFYNTKYYPVVISSVEKPHPISEKIGEDFGKVLEFQEFLKQNHGGDINDFWSKLMLLEPNRKKILYADASTYQDRLVEYFKSILKTPEADFVYELYSLNHSDNEVKLLMNLDRADNDKQIRPGHFRKLQFGNFETLYDQTPVVSFLRNKSKEDLGFELLLAEFHLNPKSTLSMFFFPRLIRLTWRTWLSDLGSLRNDLLGSLYYLDPKLDVNSFFKTNPMVRCFMDKDFNEHNTSYILGNYKAADFKELYLQINPNQPAIQDENPWNNFLKLTEMLFEQKYLELLRYDIENRKGCTYLRNHLANESNQLLASKIYEDIRLSNDQNLKRFQLA